jgi:hypothetical protein
LDQARQWDIHLGWQLQFATKAGLALVQVLAAAVFDEAAQSHV